MWPWRRSRGEERPGQRAVAPQPQPRGEWRAVAPIQRVVSEHSLVNPVERFHASLGSWQDPRLLSPLGHALGADQPSGLIDLSAPVPATRTRPEPPDGLSHASSSAGPLATDRPAASTMVSRSWAAVTGIVQRVIDAGAPAGAGGRQEPEATGPSPVPPAVETAPPRLSDPAAPGGPGDGQKTAMPDGPPMGPPPRGGPLTESPPADEPAMGSAVGELLGSFSAGLPGPAGRAEGSGSQIGAGDASAGAVTPGAVPPPGAPAPVQRSMDANSSLVDVGLATVGAGPPPDLAAAAPASPRFPAEPAGEPAVSRQEGPAPTLGTGGTDATTPATPQGAPAPVSAASAVPIPTEAGNRPATPPEPAGSAPGVVTPPVTAQRTQASIRAGEATRRLGLGEPILFHSSSAGPRASGRDLSSASGVDRPEATGPARRIDQPEAEKGGELAPTAGALPTTGLIGVDDLGLGGGAELGGGEPAPGIDPAGSVPVQRGTGGDTSPAPQGLPAVRLIGDPLPAGPQSRDAPPGRVAAPTAAPLTVARLVGDRPAPLAAGVVARQASGGGPVTVARALDPSLAPAPNHTGRASFTVAPASTMDTVPAPVARPAARFEAPVVVQRDGPHESAVPSVTAQAVTVAYAGPAVPDGPFPAAVQRQPDPASEPTVPTAPVTGPAPAAGGEPEELLAKLFDPLLRRLKAELRIDRDRRGSLTDLRL